MTEDQVLANVMLSALFPVPSYPPFLSKGEAIHKLTHDVRHQLSRFSSQEELAECQVSSYQDNYG
jgi:hypothetical protein